MNVKYRNDEERRIALNKATAASHKLNTKVYQIRLSVSKDLEMINWLESHPSKQAIIKKAVRQLMKVSE